MSKETMLQMALESIGDHSRLRHWRRVSGGDINDAYRVQSDRCTYFMKMQRFPSADFFAAEQMGLELIRKTGAIRVPYVFGSGEADGWGWLVLEWVEGTETAQTAEQLGHDLARLHQCRGPAFGLARDTYIGTLPQRNGWYGRWPDYYRDARLRPQIERAAANGLLPHERRQRLERLLERLDQWLPDDCFPSLLHGDLWSGNWIPGPEGVPYLIDPSVFYGHHEFEIAFTELFGGFPPRFYESYCELIPLPPDYHERKPLYQLFYLLVHLNLFGETYGKAVDRVLERYAGE
ncbi:fructosamine kinase [Geobacillus genomosp. 3]|uniref:Fructosamine kinase n=1 Tax=Geobacillus genomosp. 3 TaxID=1921421 RepID=S5YYI6_GEOG3|nr:fructosamine kinase family protein [Geobacillus genomosp. 3]AGT31749.1 fructosamine kinase [Geobacillus genomosp. 3]